MCVVPGVLSSCFLSAAQAQAKNLLSCWVWLCYSAHYANTERDYKRDYQVPGTRKLCLLLLLSIALLAPA